ncbi:unnamed protein product [Angiostrongylus costaricensis]|uniref:RNA helicase n=1 Tax=Angiostrongylus costaricensis TaxID=334426 RepID=A0A0R3PWC5_ANGCS|nr:unnamed protein product [Angiostrongylus costaricensis]
MQAIPLLTMHRDILASAPTEPTRELAAQTYRQFLKYGQHLPVRPALFENEDVPKNVDILVSTPNRLTHHLPDVILKYLRSFQLATIYKACDGKFTRRAFFSATFSYEVEEWCKENLNDVAMVCIGERCVAEKLRHLIEKLVRVCRLFRNSANANVTQELVFAGSEYGKLVAIRTLLQTQFEPPALIFVQVWVLFVKISKVMSKERARELLIALSSLTPPIPVSFISSEKSQSEREAVIESFRLGQVWVLICTELMGRGIDLRNVNLVINYDLPTSIVSYIHRIGRTGRAGRHGRAVTYFTESDTRYLRSIATVIHQAGFEVPEYTLSLKPLSRQVLLG